MTTSNGEASGYVVPGTGIMLNNMLGEEDLHPGGFHGAAPGERVASMMAPTLVIGDDGAELALGSGGSKRIRTAVSLVLSHLVDFDADLREAIEAPRIHVEDDGLQIEHGFASEVVEALTTGRVANVWSNQSLYFGGVHAVRPGVAAAADPRREGAARVVELS